MITGRPASFIHLADAASATVTAVAAGRGGEAWNVVDDQPVPFSEVLIEAARVFGTPKPMRLPAWAVRPMPLLHAFMAGRYPMSNVKARAELGWEPLHGGVPVTGCAPTAM